MRTDLAVAVAEFLVFPNVFFPAGSVEEDCIAYSVFVAKTRKNTRGMSFRTLAERWMGYGSSFPLLGGT